MEWLAYFETFNLQVQNWAASLGWPLEGLLRLLLAAVAGGLVGLEREIRGRQAGFRTNILVCFGSALVMVVSTQFAHVAWPQVPGVNINVDPARIAYGVMTGIGFLGAGTIVHSKGTVRGLTTAAALWCVASIGLAAGFGLYLISLIATLFIVMALWIMDYMEELLPKVRYRTVTVRRRFAPGVVQETIKRFQVAKLDVIDVSYERTDDLVYVDIGLRIAFLDKQQYYGLERSLENETDYQLMATREV